MKTAASRKDRICFRILERSPPQGVVIPDPVLVAPTGFPRDNNSLAENFRHKPSEWRASKRRSWTRRWGFDHYLEATLRRALLIRVNPGDIRPGQAMTNGKLTIADTGAETFDRFAILRETPSRQSKPTGYSRQFNGSSIQQIALLKSFVLRGGSRFLFVKDFRSPSRIRSRQRRRRFASPCPPES
jgi:hypothetical protein